MKKYLSTAILGILACWAGNAAAQTCTPTPSCTTLGYTKTAAQCPSGGAKCPWNTSLMYCADTANSTLAIGSILYSDKSVSTDIVSGKVPIGVVFDTTNRLAVSIQGSSGTWGPQVDIPSLENCSAMNNASMLNGKMICATNGKMNTSLIIDYQKSSGQSFPAANYCNLYVTTGTTAGSWFLPSAAEVQTLMQNRAKVNATLTKLGKATLSSKILHASNEAGANSSWRGYDSTNGSGIDTNAKNVSASIFPVIDF